MVLLTAYGNVFIPFQIRTKTWIVFTHQHSSKIWFLILFYRARNLWRQKWLYNPRKSYCGSVNGCNKQTLNFHGLNKAEVPFPDIAGLFHFLHMTSKVHGLLTFRWQMRMKQGGLHMGVFTERLQWWAALPPTCHQLNINHMTTSPARAAGKHGLAVGPSEEEHAYEELHFVRRERAPIWNWDSPG